MTMATDPAATRGEIFALTHVQKSIGNASIDIEVSLTDGRAQAACKLCLAAIDPELQDKLKREVAKKAVQLVKPGMVVGIGTGSTSCMAIEELAALINSGKVTGCDLTLR